MTLLLTKLYGAAYASKSTYSGHQQLWGLDVCCSNNITFNKDSGAGCVSKYNCSGMDKLQRVLPFGRVLTLKRKSKSILSDGQLSNDHQEFVLLAKRWTLLPAILAKRETLYFDVDCQAIGTAGRLVFISSFPSFLQFAVQLCRASHHVLAHERRVPDCLGSDRKIGQRGHVNRLENPGVKLHIAKLAMMQAAAVYCQRARAGARVRTHVHTHFGDRKGEGVEEDLCNCPARLGRTPTYRCNC